VGSDDVTDSLADTTALQNLRPDDVTSVEALGYLSDGRLLAFPS
jgi:hypothetical protein